MGRAEVEILNILQQTGEAYQSEVVRATGFSKSTVSEALFRLVERRLVRRVAVGKNWKVYLVGGEGSSGSPERDDRCRSRKRLCLGFTRAAEYPFLVPFKKALRETDIELEFKVYENGISVARDLSLFRIDLGIAPTLTLFMFYSLEAPIKILAPAGSGGASILLGARCSSPRGAATVTSTKISTMELMMRSAMRDSVLPDVTKVIYASGPDQMQRMLASGSADAGCIWEPYATILEARGAHRMIRYSELTEHICCALAAGNHLSEELLSKVSEQYVLSMDLFRRDPDAYMSAYGALSGLNASLLRRVSREYSYSGDLSLSVMKRQLESAGIVLPSPSSFADAVLARTKARAS